MSTGYQLVNLSKEELIIFYKLPVETKREIAGNPIASSVIAMYMMNNRGDDIRFFDDHELENYPEIYNFKEVTTKVIEELIDAGIYEDDGIQWIDKDENLYYRKFKNIWMEDTD